MLYERTAISKKPELAVQNELEQLKNEQKLSPDLVFRDPYFLEFLGLKDAYYTDLLFYHRRLKRLIAVELKPGKFEAAHKGQTELCLRWLEKHEAAEGENQPIGLILCAYQNEEHIEPLQLEQSNIKATEYLTRLPDLKLLEQKLRQAVETAKNRSE